jgi:glutathione S-transferase
MDGTMSDATWITELDDATQFVIWSYRRWVSGPQHWPLVQREYSGRFGDDQGRAALAAFARLIEALCQGAERRLEYHQACCPCVCGDELRLAALVGAAQAGGDLDRPAADLVGRTAVALLASRAADYAERLNRQGLALATPARVLH